MRAADIFVRFGAFATILLLLGRPVAAQQAGFGSVVGTVRNTNQSADPISGATVRISGPETRTVQSDAGGAFVFDAIPVGVYKITVTKPGFDEAEKSDFFVTGLDTRVDIRIFQTLSSGGMRVIGRTSVTSTRGIFNTTPAAEQVIDPQVFQDQNLYQVKTALQEVPGVTVSPMYGTSQASYLSGPGEVDSVQIRGGFAYETLTTLDGHPLYGASLYNNTGFNTGMFTSVGLKEIDIIKGPGALSSSINAAINGSVNYVTADAGGPPHGQASLGTDGYGGALFTASYRGQAANNKFGYAFGYGDQQTPGPFKGDQEFIYPFAGSTSFLVNGTVQTLPYCNPNKPTAGCVNFNTPGEVAYGPSIPPAPLLPKGTTLALCCVTQNSRFGQTSDFIKLRYNLSTATSVSFMTSTDRSLQDNGPASGNGYDALFVPPAGYAGTVPANATLPGFNTDVQPEYFRNLQTANEVDLKSTIGPGYLRLSYLGLFQSTGFYADLPLSTDHNVSVTGYGAFPIPGAPSQVLNGTPETLVSTDSYLSDTALARWRGYSAEFDLPAHGSIYSIALDSTTLNSDQGACYSFGPNSFANILACYPSLYGGKLWQRVDSAMVRDSLRLAPKVSAVASVYFNRYNNHASSASPYGPGESGGTGPYLNPAYGSTFKNYLTYYDAPRLGITWRPYTDLSYRFATGGSIAPVPLNFVASAASPPTPNQASNPTFYTQTLPAVGVKPETAFAYDVGADIRLPRQQLTLSFDGYYTLLHGLFYTNNVQTGTYNSRPLFSSVPGNLGQSVYKGLEFSALTKRPLGYNFRAAFSLIRAYTYNLAPGFYANPSTGEAFVNNLAVIPNENFRNGYDDGGFGDGTESIPYSQGSGEVSYRFKNEGLLALDAIYYGPNNGYYEPAFAVLSATGRIGIGGPKSPTSLQVNLSNIGQMYPNNYVNLFDRPGVGIPLANKTLGQSPTEGIGPRLLTVTLQHSF